MTIADLGSIAELISAILVLVSLIYLAFQLRSANEIARTDGHRDLIKQFVLWYTELRDPTLMSVLLRGSEDFAQLSGSEKLIFETCLNGYFQLCEQAHYMGRDKYLPAGTYDGFMIGAVAVTSHGGEEWWKNAKVNYAKDFVDMIDQLRKEQPISRPLRELFPTYMYADEIRKNA